MSARSLAAAANHFNEENWMPKLETFGGQVSYCRLRGSLVHSGNNARFAVQNHKAIPAGATHRGFLFSSVGAGLYPVAVVGGTMKQAIDAMNKSDIEIYIESERGLDDPAFTISAKLVRDFKVMPPVQTYDAGKMFIKNVGGFFTDVVGAATPSLNLFGKEVGSPYGLAGKGFTMGSFADGPTKLLDVRSSPKESKEFFSGGMKSSGKSGVIISIYSDHDSIKTGRRSIRMDELASMLYHKV
jgi:hypothetical protein